jgi:sigma-B regulation protein RsbU (phosphoserine phosphatase)
MPKLSVTSKRHTPASLLAHAVQRRTVRKARPSLAPAAPAPSSDELRRQAEIEHDLRLARDIQQGLLLEAVPRLPGWEISAISLPAHELGGDLYDFLPMAHGWHGIMIGDVSGKGLPAALRMAVARTVFRHAARRDEGPGLTLAETNSGIISEIPQGMVTMLYAKLDTRHGDLWLANAGHNYPIIINAQVSELELSGLPLGVDDEGLYEEAHACIEPGNTVVLYTDGVVEAGPPEGEIYSYSRLEHMLRANAHLKPRALVAALLQELRTWNGHQQADDITMVVIRRRLADLGHELRSIADDVLGTDRAGELWRALDLEAMAASTAGWAERMPALIGQVQSRFGRGFARELHAQLRLALEEYRLGGE